MRMLKIPLALLITLAMLWVAIAPVFADDGGKKIGDKQILSTGDVAEVIGFTPEGSPIWEATFGEPTYIPGTDILYDETWYPDGKGGYYAGANDFTAEVKGKGVKVDYQGKQSNWSPDFKISGITKAEKSVTPTLLAVDPVNPNYTNNTLMWDYNNGVKRYLRIIEGMLIEYYKIDSPLYSDIVIRNNLSDDKGFDYHRPAYAFDAEDNTIEISQDGGYDVILPADKSITTKDKTGKETLVVYPITIDPDTTFTSTSSDAYMYNQSGWVADTWNNIYNGEHDQATASGKLATADFMGVAVKGYYWPPDNEYTATISRAFIYFNTASIPDGASLDTAIISLYGKVTPTADWGAWNMIVQEGMDTYPHDPLVTADMLFSYYTGDGGTLASGSMDTGWVNFTLNATGEGWINDDGYTKLCFKEKGYDADDTTPASPPFGGKENEWYWYTYEKGEGFRPYLTITYTATAPVITVDAASNVAKTTARINATVADDGLEDCEVRFGYGTTTQTALNFALYDTLTDWSAAIYETGEHPFVDIDTLNADDDYFYRAQIKNSHSTVTSVSEITFHTDAAISEPESLRAYPHEESISVSWVKGDGSSQTMIRWSTTTFPTTTATGTLLYEGVANSAELEDLEAGRTYYISGWGESGAAYSASYATVAATTIPFDVGVSDDLESPTMFDRWFGEPDYTNLSNLEPIYSAVNGVADSFGTPRNTAWVVGYLMIVAIVSVGLMMARGGFAAGLVVSVILLVAGVGMQILPAWMIFMAILLGVFGWAMNKRGFNTQ